MVVEGHAWTQHIDERKAVVAHTGLNERHELRLVAGKAASHESGSEGQRQQNRVDRRG